MRVQIPTADISKAFGFAFSISKGDNQSSTDFGRQDIRRSMNDRIADCAEGKLAEFGFMEFAKTFGIEVGLDFKIYSDIRTTDFGQDVESVDGKRCLYRVDIKATRSSSQWLLIDRHKFMLGCAFVLVKAKLPMDLECKTEEQLKSMSMNPVDAEIMGFAYAEDMIDQETNQPWFWFPKGSRLYSTQLFAVSPEKQFGTVDKCREKTRVWLAEGRIREIGPVLKSEENFGFPVRLLRNSELDWGNLFGILKKTSEAY